MDKITIKIPPKSIYLKSLRLLSSSLASDVGFDIEKVEDMRVLVSEAVNYKMSDEDIKIKFMVEKEKITVEVKGKDRIIEQKALEMKNLILESLADKVQVKDDKIILTKEK